MTAVFGKASARSVIIFGQPHYFHRHLPEKSILECRRSAMVRQTFVKIAEVLFSAMQKCINCKCWDSQVHARSDSPDAESGWGRMSRELTILPRVKWYWSRQIQLEIISETGSLCDYGLWTTLSEKPFRRGDYYVSSPQFSKKP